VLTFSAPYDCKIVEFDGQMLGNLMVMLKAGRKQALDKINADVSMQFLAYPNQELKKGVPILHIYHPNP